MPAQDRCQRNSMTEHIGPEYVFSQIQLLRDEHRGACLLVEGETDQLVYERFIDPLACLIVIAHGRDNALQVLTLLATVPRASIAGVLAILDADFDRLDGVVHPPQVLLTDTHDLETLLFASPALDKVLREFGSEKKIAAFTSLHGHPRTHLPMQALCIGYLLWCSRHNGLNLRFANLKFGKFVDDRRLLVDEAQLVQAVLRQSQEHTHPPEALLLASSKLRDPSHDPLQVCCGHHLIELLAIGLRKALGTNDAHQVAPEVLERSLRLAFEEAHFIQTALWRSLRQWQEQNPAYPVLRGPAQRA